MPAALAILVALPAVLLGAARADEILYQSATLGPTGITSEQQAVQGIAGTNVGSAVFVGVKFQISQRANVTGVGGHFTGGAAGGTFFGAIVALENAEDFPDSTDLTTSDVLGATLLDFPYPSADVVGTLALELEPGWYGVVFGSGSFGATGAGAALRNNSAIGSPLYFGWQTSLPWASRVSTANGQRLVVFGSLIPEPNSIWILTIACSFLLSRSKKLSRNSS